MTKQQLKRRLVGAIVLASLAVIFIPMLLDSRVADEQLGVVIPPRDSVAFNEELARGAADPMPVPAAPQPVDSPSVPAAPATADVPVNMPEPVAPTEVPVSPGAAITSPSLRAWVVQVGSFSQADNAAAVAARLRGAGFDTVVDKVEISGQTLYRVQVGPEADEGRAQRLLGQIQDKLKMDGTVRQHKPD